MKTEYSKEEITMTPEEYIAKLQSQVQLVNDTVESNQKYIKTGNLDNTHFWNELVIQISDIQAEISILEQLYEQPVSGVRMNKKNILEHLESYKAKYEELMKEAKQWVQK